MGGYDKKRSDRRNSMKTVIPKPSPKDERDIFIQQIKNAISIGDITLAKLIYKRKLSDYPASKLMLYIPSKGKAKNFYSLV